MPTQRIQAVILLWLSLLLSSHSYAQDNKRIMGVDKTGVQTSASGEAASLPQRTTFTMNYTPLFYKNALFLLPLVTGSFPNHQQARFFVDTGSDNIVVSENLSRKLGLTPLLDKNLPADGATLGGNPIKQVVLPDFDMKASSASSPLLNAQRLGDLKVNGPAVVIPQQDTDFFGADGIIGTNILDKAGAILFDGPSLELTFILGGNLTAAEREQLGFSNTAAFVALTPLNPNNSGVFTVPVTLENNGSSEPVALILDTGSMSTIISRKTALTLSLQATTLSNNSTGVAGTQKMDGASVETVKIGDLVLHSVAVLYPNDDHEAPSTLQPKGNSTERLGMNILMGYRVLIDFSSRAMYVAPDPPKMQTPTH